LHITCGFSCGFGFPAKTFVGNHFLRFLEPAEKFPAEIAAEDKYKFTENFPANNPQIISQ
jgi:hypothetical protein